MNEDIIEDLKQFISVTIGQNVSEVKDDLEKLDKKLNKRIDKVDRNLSDKIDAIDHKLSRKIDDLSAAVADAMSDGQDATDQQLKNHEKRIARLEHKTA